MGSVSYIKVTWDDVYSAELWEILSALTSRSGLLAGVTPSHRSIPMELGTGRGALEGKQTEAWDTHLWKEATRSYRACMNGRIQWWRRTTLWDRLRWKASILTSRGTYVCAWHSSASSRSRNSSPASSGGKEWRGWAILLAGWPHDGQEQRKARF